MPQLHQSLAKNSRIRMLRIWLFYQLAIMLVKLAYAVENIRILLSRSVALALTGADVNQNRFI